MAPAGPPATTTASGSATSGAVTGQFLSGHYTYREVTRVEDSDHSPYGGTGVWSIRAEPRQGDHQKVTYYQGEEKRNNTVVDVLRWSPDRRDLAERTSAGRTCQWRPVVLDLRLPVVAGSAWSGTSMCSVGSEQSTLKYRVSVGTPRTMNVPGHGRQRIWPVQRVYDLTYSIPGYTARSVTTLDIQYLPGMLIPFHEVQRVVSYQPDGKQITDTKTRDLNAS